MSVITRQDLCENCFQQMIENGIHFAGKLVTDGKIHRFSLQQKQDVHDEWYIAWDGISDKGNPWICCIYGTWTGGGEKYCYKSWEEHSRRFNLVEQEEFRKIWEQKRKELEREESKESQDSLMRAKGIWKTALELPKTDLHKKYLQLKQVRAYGIKYGYDYQGNDVLIVPSKNLKGEIQAVQFIYVEGKKRIHGLKKGNFHTIGDINEDSIIYIVEGYATGASVHQAIGNPVVIAFDCGNLYSVLQNLRTQYPNNKLVIAADDDVETQGNPGKTKAEEAAKIFGCKVVIPTFPFDFKLSNGKKPTDFNDLHLNFGLEEIAKQLSTNYLIALDIADLLSREFPPRTSILDPWLPEKGLTMIYAPRGIGKTFLSLSIAYAIACGESFLNWKVEKPRKILYIDGEMPAVAMKERLIAIAKAFKKTPPDSSYFRIVSHEFQSEGIHDIGSIKGQEDINALMKEADLVIIDNLSTLVRSGNENEADSWVHIQEWFLQQRKLGKAVLLIHHAGKNGGQRGTSKREDILDTVISLKKPKNYTPNDGARFEIHFEKSRGFYGEEASSFEASLVSDSKGALSWKKKAIDSHDLELVVNLYNDGITTQRIIAKETNMSVGKVNRLINEAKTKQMIL